MVPSRPAGYVVVGGQRVARDLAAAGLLTVLLLLLLMVLMVGVMIVVGMVLVQVIVGCITPARLTIYELPSEQKGFTLSCIGDFQTHISKCSKTE